jgi:hypothetical protein
MPKGTRNGWMSSGNTETCEAQAFCIIFALMVTPFYNASLCIFYLLKIRYEVTDQMMAARIEPFLHCIPILIALCYCSYGLVREWFNSSIGICARADYPLGCSTRENVVCERGEGIKDGHDYLIPFITTSIIVPVIIITSMITVLITVIRQEERILNYGVGSLSIDARGSPRHSSNQVWLTLVRG